MRIIPVIDLKCGLVVRAIAGRRHQYQPITSKLTRSCQPTDVAQAFQEILGLTEVYLADVDAIAGAAPAMATYEALRHSGIRLWVDAGIREAASATALAAAGVDTIIAALETIPGPDLLTQVCENLDRSRVVFSLDLRDGRPLALASAWSRPDAICIADEAVARGMQRLLILDLARVGMDQGTGTEAVCHALHAAHPQTELSAGGGVRNRHDLLHLKRQGISAALIASALHDGKLQPEDWADL
jgi:phosphoribosylformimino-5-aminoimidazole carboxamide ribotide isomerase